MCLRVYKENIILYTNGLRNCLTGTSKWLQSNFAYTRTYNKGEMMFSILHATHYSRCLMGFVGFVFGTHSSPLFEPSCDDTSDDTYMKQTRIAAPHIFGLSSRVLILDLARTYCRFHPALPKRLPVAVVQDRYIIPQWGIFPPNAIPPKCRTIGDADIDSRTRNLWPNARGLEHTIVIMGWKRPEHTADFVDGDDGQRLKPCDGLIRTS